jgi:hypothetical protein
VNRPPAAKRGCFIRTRRRSKQTVSTAGRSLAVRHRMTTEVLPPWISESNSICQRSPRSVRTGGSASSTTRRPTRTVDRGADATRHRAQGHGVRARFASVAKGSVRGIASCSLA